VTTREAGKPQSRGWDKSLKPKWKIELEEAHDEKWLEAGTYQFICKSCRAKNIVHLTSSFGRRAVACCEKCDSNVEL
jgi:hypothetical protein